MNYNGTVTYKPGYCTYTGHPGEIYNDSFR